MTAAEVLQAVQTTFSGALIVILNKLWRAFEKQNERVYKLLLAAEDDRRNLADRLSMETQPMTDVIREKRKGRDTHTEA